MKLLAKGGFSLTNFVSNVRSVLSILNRTLNPIDGNVKALAVEDESSIVLGLKWNYQFDTLVVSRGTTPYCNRILTQKVGLNLVLPVYDPIGPVPTYAVKARLLLKDIW